MTKQEKLQFLNPHNNISDKHITVYVRAGSVQTAIQPLFGGIPPVRHYSISMVGGRCVSGALQLMTTAECFSRRYFYIYFAFIFVFSGRWNKSRILPGLFGHDCLNTVFRRTITSGSSHHRRHPRRQRAICPHGRRVV